MVQNQIIWNISLLQVVPGFLIKQVRRFAFPVLSGEFVIRDKVSKYRIPNDPNLFLILVFLLLFVEKLLV